MSKADPTSRSTAKQSTGQVLLGPKPVAPTTLGEEDRYFSRSVAKGFASLDAFEREDRLWSLGEMGAAVSLTKSSTYRLLHTLQRLGSLSEPTQGRCQLTRMAGAIRHASERC